MLLIYTDLISSRLEYILKIFFNQVFGLDYQITSDKQTFLATNGPKFSYSENNNFPGQPFISSHKLLFETDIHPIEIQTFKFEGQIAFFKATADSFFPFDVFAASFYLISRYEEYLPYREDKYGRFSASESLAFQKGFLDIPLVNIWANILKDKLMSLFPELSFQNREFEFLSTIDIDNAWAHIHKGFIRIGLSIIKHILVFDFVGLYKKMRVLRHFEDDPYDNYHFIELAHKKYNFWPIFFILFSQYSKYDKNISTKNRYFRELVKKLSLNYQIGHHPSYQSNKAIKILSEEKISLEKLIEKPITMSRQHYLYLKMPKTYENLIKIGIHRDFSMGYSSHIGFRAGYCLPFKFFNLLSNIETELEIIPFALMDVCFKDYLKIRPEIALIKIKKMISSIKNVNGLFVSLWHNEMLTNAENNVGWRFVFEQMLKEIKNGNQAY